MLNIKKILLIPSIVSIPLLVTTVTSCSIVEPDVDLAAQIEALTSPEAKETYSNIWSREAFAHLYLVSLDTNVNTDTSVFEYKQKDKIMGYLKKFDESELKDITLMGGFATEALLAEDILNKLFNAYKFYTSWKSSADLEYFINQSVIWKQKFEGLESFDPPYGYSSNEDNATTFHDDFLSLYKEVQTGIQTELLNMMIAQFYFTSTTENIIKRGTNYNEVMKGDINTLEHWTANSFDVKSPTYFLEKYLVTKTPKIKWNYTSENPDNIIDNTNTTISKPSQYNKLWQGEQVGTPSSPKTIFSKDLIVNSGDKEFDKFAIDFYGYNSAIELSSPSGDGDLATSIDAMIGFGSTYSGLWNSETKKLNSYDDLALKETLSQEKPPLQSVSLKIDTKTTRKNSTQITKADLLIGGKGEAEIDPLYTVDKIVPILGTSSRQTINVQMEYKGYPYDVTVSWDQKSNPAEANIESELSENYTWTFDSSFGKRQKPGINPIVENKVNVTYYIRLLPRFVWDDDQNEIKETIEINGESKAIGKFTMDETPWAKLPANQQKLENLAFSLYMNDAELLNEIKSILVLNDISLERATLEGKPIPQVDDILAELGILVVTNKPDYVDPTPSIPPKTS